MQEQRTSECRKKVTALTSQQRSDTGRQQNSRRMSHKLHGQPHKYFKTKSKTRQQSPHPRCHRPLTPQLINCADISSLFYHWLRDALAKKGNTQFQLRAELALRF